ncbi:MAG: PEGA domain-containing protein [Deltaproteobacteria bacterium]|nr:MAG: PEGA domain-containing protein [Deltaproteobacteria bacterium]
MEITVRWSPPAARAYNWARLGARVIIAAMARPLVLTACLVLGLGRSAVAGGAGPGGPGKTSKVTIETDPPGAKVYFNVKEDGEVCTTPCTIDAPIGETPIIVEAENRRSIIENLVVPRKTARPLRVSYKLKPALGTLVVDGGDGAAITIDDEAQGTAPRRFEDIAAGAHHVVVEKNGRKLLDEFVEVEIGGEVTVTPKPAAPAPPPPVIDTPAVTATQASAAPPRSTPAFAIAARTDIGFRQFDFSYPDSTPGTKKTNDNDREVAEVLAGATVDLWPTTLLHLGVLPGLALHGRFQIGVNPQAVTIRTNGMTTPTPLTTSWLSFEGSLLHRWTIAGTAALEVGAGYTDDRYHFTREGPMTGTDYSLVVPDTAYKAVQIGGRLSLLLGRFEPYFALENRIVLSGGELANRYTISTSVDGLLLALGAAVRLGPFEVRAEGSRTRYSWTLRPNTSDADQATSASDAIEKISLALGYVY